MVERTVQLDQLLGAAPARPAHGGCGSCGSGQNRCGNGLEKIYPTTAVRYGYMRYIGEFSHPADMKFTCGARVIVQTGRGIEVGEQVSLTCSGCDKSVTRDQMRAWVKSCGEDAFIFDAGRILREATASDLAEWAHIQRDGHAKRRVAQHFANRHKLPLKVVECETPFGGERIVFFFMAEQRVDFRGMVRDLATEFRTHIEMRQVGARDEARLLADYETCGREVCCKVFLKTLRPISMKMAKLQKATLDPSKVSGRCGRLKCCLRYEHVGYEELHKKLPRMGARIRTSHGDGVVVGRQVLTQLVQIRCDDDTRITVVAEDILDTNAPPPDAAPAATTPLPRPRTKPGSPPQHRTTTTAPRAAPGTDGDASRAPAGRPRRRRRRTGEPQRSERPPRDQPSTTPAPHGAKPDATTTPPATERHEPPDAADARRTPPAAGRDAPPRRRRGRRRGRGRRAPNGPRGPGETNPPAPDA
ncbi:MAG: regulatory iron-sulfur-containing complex subunit RicT [Phycisphaerae bacterium]